MGFGRLGRQFYPSGLTASDLRRRTSGIHTEYITDFTVCHDHDDVSVVPQEPYEKLRPTMRLTPLQKVSVVYSCHSELVVFSARAYLSTHNIARRDPRAPRIVGKQRSQRFHHSRNLASKQVTDYTKWPIAIITAAEKSGTLTVTPQRAITILDDFQALGSKPVQTFCTGMNE